MTTAIEERERDKDRDKGRVRARVVESGQVGVCWPGPSGAIDPGWPYIRDRKPELHASSPSPRSPPSLLSSKSLLSSLLLSSPLLSSPLLSMWSRACQPPLQAAVNSSFHGRGWLHPGAKCTQPSIHNHSFIILPVHVCGCVCTCGSQCVNMCAHQCGYYAQPVLPVCLSYCFEWREEGIMGASAMRLEGNKVRLSNLFRRHRLLWE